MVQVDNLQPEELKIALYGWTGSGWIELKTNIYGVLEIAQPIAGDLKVGLYGWDGDGWKRLLVDGAGHSQVDVLTVPTVEVVGLGGGQVLAIEDVIGNDHSKSASAGDNIQAGTAATAGKIWVITTAAAWNETSICTGIELYLVLGGGRYPTVGRIAMAGVNEAAVIRGQVILGAGQKLYARYLGCQAGDTLGLGYSGYEMTEPA